MIPEFMEMAKAGALDLAAREEMGLFTLKDEGTPEGEFLDLVCEVAAEHIPVPEDRSLESFDLVVGGIISAFFSYKAYQALKHIEGVDE